MTLLIVFIKFLIKIGNITKVFHLKVAVEVRPLVAKSATHQVEAVLVLPTWLQIIVVIMIVVMIKMKMWKKIMRMQTTWPGPQSDQWIRRPVGNQDH